jgi:ABC-type proline/glycine betaine transport system permease subunit
MMPVFGALGRNVAPLKSIGVAGIGWAPVFVVLLVYALYPVVRNTIAAIRALDPGVLDAARGMGMGQWRLLAEVELPLGFPVVLAGVRIALVQSTAGAVIAAFVGGGGLGTIMFFGLEQTSMDLVLVGVLPIVALALRLRHRPQGRRTARRRDRRRGVIELRNVTKLYDGKPRHRGSLAHHRARRADDPPRPVRLR